MGQGGKRNYFRGDIWFQEKVGARTKASLEQQEKQFSVDHKNDTDEQLLAYLRDFTAKMGHTPNPGEIIGGQYLFRRFGDWENAVRAAGLPKPGKKAQPTHRLIYKEEFKRQAILFQKERAVDREERQAKRQEASRIATEAQKARELRDMAWGQEHSDWDREQLSEYLRQCATSLGHTPFMKEVVGGVYIAKRFVCWPLALTVAGLSLPDGMKAPGKKDIEKYKNLLAEEAGEQENSPLDAV